MITEVDKEALTRAIELCRAESAARSKQLDAKLRSEPWEDVARFAAYCSQTRTLLLEPWEWPPMWITEIDAALKMPDDARKIPDGARLLQRMLDAGLSQYEPDPLRAVNSSAF